MRADPVWGNKGRPREPHLRAVSDSSAPADSSSDDRCLVLERYDDVKLSEADTALIEDVFDLGGLAVIYGASNSGKTFWTMDAALHIAAGRMWRGKRVQQVPVLYLALEGGRGAIARIVAWRSRYGLASLPFWLVRAPLNLMTVESTELIETAANTIEKTTGSKPGLTVVDTLARAMAGGNENAPEDMGSLVRGADEIRMQTGGAVWFVHHSGKDEARGARGHSSLLAATDTEIEIAVLEGGQRVARATKQREMEKGGEWPFTLQKVTLAEVHDRKPITSCTVVHVEDDGTPLNKKRPNGQTGLALRILSDVVAECGKPTLPCPQIPASAITVNSSVWRESFYLRAMPDAEYDAKQKAFRRASKELIERQFVAQYGAAVWIV
jgi:AAA domain